VSSRFLLLSGSAGRPTTLADSGRRHLLIDASKPVPIHPVVRELIESSLGRIMGQLGGEATDAQMWSGLPTVAHLSTLQQFLDGLADPQFDRVVLDCGSREQARDLVQAPDILLGLLDFSLTPRLAMWRFPGEAESDATVFESLSEVRNHLLRMQRELRHDDTVLRIVAADAADEKRCRDAAAMLGMLGIASEVWLWDERVADVAPLALGEVQVDGDEYRLDLALSGSAASRSRVGRRDDDLVIELDGVYRWLNLPPVLLRCHARDAERTADGLRVRFARDASQWRQPEERSA